MRVCRECIGTLHEGESPTESGKCRSQATDTTITLANRGERLMSKVFTDVATFMTAAGQAVPPFTANPSAQSDLYFELIKEEYREMMDANLDKNDTEICDACFDLIWVVVGYMQSRGWNCEDIWDEGAKSNLSKIDSATGKVIKREDGKILKPDGWKPPNFEKFVK